MSDIRKEFEKLAINLDLNFFRNKEDDECYWYPETQKAYEAYKAGRAHDIEGLIAEIMRLKYPQNECEPASYKALHNSSVESCAEIIRKHFGKE